jgi:hypothetical protein
MKRKPPSSKLVQAIARRFTFHSPEGDQATRYHQIRAQAGAFAQELAKLCPDGDEFRQALINLDAVVFFANAAIAREIREEPEQDE